jgi:hypothetical protein
MSPSKVADRAVRAAKRAVRTCMGCGGTMASKSANARWCSRECINAHVRESRATDPEYNKRRRERYATDSEYRAKTIARVREWYATDPEKCRAYQRAHRLDPKYRAQILQYDRERDARPRSPKGIAADLARKRELYETDTKYRAAAIDRAALRGGFRRALGF